MSIIAISSGVARRPNPNRGRDSSRASASSRSFGVSAQRRHSPWRSTVSLEGGLFGSAVSDLSGTGAGVPGEQAHEVVRRSTAAALYKSELHAPIAVHLPCAKVVEVIARVRPSHL